METYYRAQVRERTWLTPHMVRVRFGSAPGEVVGASALSTWATSGCGDERLVVVLPPEGASEPPLPVWTETGWDYPDPDAQPPMRSYTVRAWDPERVELTIDFVAHEGGVAATWAQAARPGDLVLLSEAAGWYAPPADATWQLLVADMTALPALGRIAEQSPLRTLALVEVIDAADRQTLPEGVEARWLCGSGNGHGPSALLRAVRDTEWPEGPGYIWFAGEAAESRRVRKYLRHELGLGVDRYCVLGYWRVAKEAWMARYSELSAELEQVYTDAIARGLTSNDALEVYDDALERVGL